MFFARGCNYALFTCLQVKSSTTIWVSLVQKAEGTQWADEPGPLKLVAIDTGAGRLLLREDVSHSPPSPGSAPALPVSPSVS